jgi:hypothetical protein
MAASEGGGGFGRAVTTAFTLLIVLGLAGVVVFLLSDINRRNYRLAQQGDHLIVERGRRAPIGFQVFEPETEDLKRAYAPIQIPPGEVISHFETVDDRADLDRTIFSLLSGWSRERLDTTKKEVFELVSGYLKRCALLPGVSSEQERELRTLQADVAYRNAQRIVEKVIQDLEDAVSALRMSQRLGTSRNTDADAKIQQLEELIATLRDSGREPTLSPRTEPTAPRTEPQPLPKSPSSQPRKEGEGGTKKWRL